MSPLASSFLKGFMDRAQAEGQAWDWLFPAQSASGHTVNIDDSFKRVVIAAGLDPTKVTPHTMRNTVITQLHVSGVDVATIQRIIGHKDAKMVYHYARPSDPHIQSALLNLPQHL